jgi:predicted hotdog family 3-hydroxylacyl-ACP dehydratase
MRLVASVIRRDRVNETGEVDAVTPETGMWTSGGRVTPEYLVELTAQAMAAVNGYDLLCKGKDARTGFLVGVDTFSWNFIPDAGVELRIKLQKKFEMYPVTIMEGRVFASGKLVSRGEIKVWEVEEAV